MTTIFCNKKWLLIDTRTSISCQSNHRLFTDAKISRDDCSKLVDVRDFSVFYKGTKVEVLAYAGCVSFCHQFIQYLKNLNDEIHRRIAGGDIQLDLDLALKFATNFSTANYSSKAVATMFFVLEGTGVVKASFTTNEETNLTSVTVRRYWYTEESDPDVSMVAGGSGYGYFRGFEKFLNPKASMVSLFLFACHLDPSSSNGTFHMYDRKNKTIGRFVLPKAEIQKRIRTTMTGMINRVVGYEKPQTVFTPKRDTYGAISLILPAPVVDKSKKAPAKRPARKKVAVKK